MQPLITLQDNGSAVLNYDVPQPTVYRGRVAYQISVNPSYFRAVNNPFTVSSIKQKPSLDEIRKAMINGFMDQSIFPQIGVAPNFLAYVDDQPDVPIKYRPWQGVGAERQVNTGVWFKGIVVIGTHGWNSAASSYVGPQVGFDGSPDPYITDELAIVTPERVLKRLLSGYRLFISKNGAGQYTCSWELIDAMPKQGIAIIERYQLSSFLGNYGAGRTVQTFTLLPGEKSKISIKSYTRTITTTKSTSSIFDSYDNQSAQEFSDTIASEHTNKRDTKDSLKWHVDVEAESDFGVVSAKASANYKGAKNSSREQFGKELSQAVAKHATKASSKRDIKIQQSQETTTETGDESGIEREIQNVNVGRTLNFVFRQMNQEYITLLHLVDVELAYTTGFPGGGRRYALADLNKMLADVIVDTPGYRDEISSRILAELQNIYDYQGNSQSFIEQVSLAGMIPAGELGADPVATYYRPKRGLTTSYTSQSGKVIGNIPGILLNATETVLRTDGLIVEALLGQGEGLDDYSMSLQTAAVTAARNANSLKGAAVSHRQLIASVASSGDAGKGKIYAMLYPNRPCPPLPGG